MFKKLSISPFVLEHQGTSISKILQHLNHSKNPSCVISAFRVTSPAPDFEPIPLEENERNDSGLRSEVRDLVMSPHG